MWWVLSMSTLLQEALEVAINSFEYDGEHKKADALRTMLENITA